jgi:hypothetical protein
LSNWDYQIVQELKALVAIEGERRDIENQALDELRQIRIALVGRPTKMQLEFEGQGAGMPGKETDTQTIPCSALETDAAGNPVDLNPASVTWAIDDPTIATLTQNPDGSATFKALKVGTANVSCTDGSVAPPLVGTDTLTVTAGAANKLVLQFGAAA